MSLARSTAPGDWKDHRHVGGIDLLLEWYTDRTGEAPLAQALPERCGEAIAGIGKHAAETHGCRGEPVNLGQRNLGLGPVGTMIVGHSAEADTSTFALFGRIEEFGWARCLWDDEHRITGNGGICCLRPNKEYVAIRALGQVPVTFLF